LVERAVASVSPTQSTYEDWMRLALAEASAAGDDEEIPVGAVVLSPAGDIVGRGHNVREQSADPTAHAEIVALRAAAVRLGIWRLDGCTLVVTLEPCAMCAGALLLARVSRLVMGAWSPDAGAVGSVWDVVRDRRTGHHPEVVGGVLEAECSALLAGWFAERRAAGLPEPRSPQG
jgi:tRNA(adenine34) deaminase